MLLAARENGYRSLMRLSSRAYLETAPHERPHIKLAWLDGETDGLIALTGGPSGPLDVAIAGGQNALALARCEELQRLFGDRLYIELQRHGMASERAVEPALIELGYGRGIAAGRHQRAVLRHARGLRSPRRAACASPKAS